MLLFFAWLSVIIMPSWSLMMEATAVF